MTGLSIAYAVMGISGVIDILMFDNLEPWIAFIAMLGLTGILLGLKVINRPSVLDRFPQMKGVSLGFIVIALFELLGRAGTDAQPAFLEATILFASVSVIGTFFWTLEKSIRNNPEKDGEFKF